MIRLPATPLFLQALGLVIATLVASWIATVVVILSMPAPPPEIYTVADVAAAIQGDLATPTREGRPLMTQFSPSPPRGDVVGRRRAIFRGALARTLNISPDLIVITQHARGVVAFMAQPRGLPFHHRPPFQNVDPEQPLLFGGFHLGVRQPDGRWLIVKPKTAFGIDPWQQRVLTRDQLLEFARGPHSDAFDRAIDVQISRLRRKLEDGGGGQELIRTVRNEGYLFTAKVSRTP